MPKPMRTGRDRLDYKGDPALIDMVKSAAAKVGWPLSLWVRTAFESLLRSQGFSPPPPLPPPVEPPALEPKTKRTRGKPRKSSG